MRDDKIKAGTRNLKFRRKVFAMRQVRDCVEGSDSIKRAGELYLPMPSGMSFIPVGTSKTASVNNGNPLSAKDISITEAPWYHPNPAYSAYLHRAKFPDMTAATLRGLTGIATKRTSRS
jgi:hypothetical protein